MNEKPLQPGERVCWMLPGIPIKNSGKLMGFSRCGKTAFIKRDSYSQKQRYECVDIAYIYREEL